MWHKITLLNLINNNFRPNNFNEVNESQLKLYEQILIDKTS